MRIAYTALHYGCEYLPWAIRSVQDVVDEIHILYSPQPSYGHGSPFACPESEEELREAAGRFCIKPLFWHRGQWNGEGVHREAILPIAEQRKADQILWVDADEVWDLDTLRLALHESAKRPEREIRVRFLHLWKSFHWCCIDPCMPVRIINLKGDGTWYLAPQEVPVFHFGYALKPDMMAYKWSIHGHLAEYKAGWLEKTYVPWQPGMDDVHPTCGLNERGVPFWTPHPIPEEFASKLGILMHDHPYAGFDIIR